MSHSQGHDERVRIRHILNCASPPARKKASSLRTRNRTDLRDEDNASFRSARLAASPIGQTPVAADRDRARMHRLHRFREDRAASAGLHPTLRSQGPKPSRRCASSFGKACESLTIDWAPKSPRTARTIDRTQRRSSVKLLASCHRRSTW